MQTQPLAFLGGVGAGAALMYLIDPDRGKRRRGIVRDKVVHATHKAADAVDATARDVVNRAHALNVSRKSKSDEVPDDKLVARVRSKMGRIVSHPSAIEVSADQGRVTLSGPILKREVKPLLKAIVKIPGVKQVENRMEPHKGPSNIPSLQGGRQRPGDRPEFMQENWSPTARLLASAAGGALTAYGLKRRGPLKTLLSTAGAALLLRGATNLTLKRLTGIGAGRRAVEMQKDINIAAPVEQIYGFWSNMQNFPRFMAHVQEVRSSGDGRWHWEVKGPAGAVLEWDAIVTDDIPNKLLAWKSVEGATVANSGIVRFDPNDDGTTRVEVKLSYNPPGGAVGHALAAALGSDPKHQMDEDLLRLKTLLETGIKPHDAACQV